MPPKAKHGVPRGSATSLTEEEFPVVFGAMAVIAGVAHAMSFALGYMLCERVELCCQLRRSDFHTDPSDPDFGSVSIRGVNKKTKPRESWMARWIVDVFQKEEIRIPCRAVACGCRGGQAKAQMVEDSVWNVPKTTEGQFQFWCNVVEDTDGMHGDLVLLQAPRGALVEIISKLQVGCTWWQKVRVRPGRHVPPPKPQRPPLESSPCLQPAARIKPLPPTGTQKLARAIKFAFQSAIPSQNVQLSLNRPLSRQCVVFQNGGGGCFRFLFSPRIPRELR
jgi:hypothetical protein